MKDRHASRDSGHEFREPVNFSNSQKALNPELYLAQVALDTALFTRSEKVPCMEKGWFPPMADSASGIVCNRNLFVPLYLSRPESMVTIQQLLMC
jgi:hypothetical protein